MIFQCLMSNSNFSLQIQTFSNVEKVVQIKPNQISNVKFKSNSNQTPFEAFPSNQTYLTIDIQNMMKHNILQQLRLEHITWRFLKYIWHVELYCVIWKVSPCNYSLNTFLHTESVSCQTYSSLIPIKYMYTAA